MTSAQARAEAHAMLARVDEMFDEILVHARGLHREMDDEHHRRAAGLLRTRATDVPASRGKAGAP